MTRTEEMSLQKGMTKRNWNWTRSGISWSGGFMAIFMAISILTRSYDV